MLRGRAMREARHRRAMSTIVRLVDGEQLEVAEDLEAVINAVVRFHPKPVPLESAAGDPLYVNWDHVVYVRTRDPEHGEPG